MENRLKNKFAVAQVKIFIVTRISGNKSFFIIYLFFIWPDKEFWYFGVSAVTLAGITMRALNR